MTNEPQVEVQIEEMEPMSNSSSNGEISNVLEVLLADPANHLMVEDVEFGGNTFRVHEADAEQRFELLRILQQFFDLEREEVGDEEVIDDRLEQFAIRKNQYPLKAHLIALCVTDFDGRPICTVEDAEDRLRKLPALVDALYPVVSRVNRLGAKESDLELEKN